MPQVRQAPYVERPVSICRRDGTTRQVLLSECRLGAFEKRGYSVPGLCRTKFGEDIARAVGYWPNFGDIRRAPDNLVFVECSASLFATKKLYFELSRECVEELLDICNADGPTRLEWVASAPGAIPEKRRRGRWPGRLTNVEKAKLVLSQRMNRGDSYSIREIEKEVGCSRGALRKSPGFMEFYTEMVSAHKDIGYRDSPTRGDDEEY